MPPIDNFANKMSHSTAKHSQARVVLKFGGTSMGSFAAMQRCAEIVLGYVALPQHAEVPLALPAMHSKSARESAPTELAAVLQGFQKVAVVVSAVAGVTDSLENIFCESSNSSIPLAQRQSRLAENLQHLRHKHEKIIEDGALHFARQAAKTDTIAQSYRTELNLRFDLLKELLQNQLEGRNVKAEEDAAYCTATKDLSKRQASCLAFGEKLSSCIFSFVLQQNISKQASTYGFADCVVPCPLQGEELIASDSNFLNAKLHFAQSKLQIESKFSVLWQQNQLPVIAGFTAADKDEQTTLLGRGGSDFSAAIIAAALELPTLDIWTDVAGIYSSDPRLVPNARLWDKLDFALVSEMAYSGAQVVQPKSISIALQSQVAVIVRSTFAPQEKGTVIIASQAAGGNIPSEQPCVQQGEIDLAQKRTKLTGLVLSHDSMLLHMENPNMLEGEGYIAQIAGAAHKQEIPIDVCATSETTFSFSIHHSDCNQQLLDDLQQIGKISVIRHLHKLCCVGEQIGSNVSFIAELLLECRAMGIQLETLSIGASHANVTLLFQLGKQQLSNWTQSPKDLCESAELLEAILPIRSAAHKEQESEERNTAIELLRRLHRRFLEI